MEENFIAFGELNKKKIWEWNSAHRITAFLYAYSNTDENAREEPCVCMRSIYTK